jgi:hypothetical protein
MGGSKSGNPNKGHFKDGVRADGRETREHKRVRLAAAANNAVVRAVKSNMSGEVMLVTPEAAGKWLEHNYNGQRRIQWERVTRYAEDMAAGKWIVTHQGIAFAPDGTLLDGQHRLWAIVQTERPMNMYVVRNASPESYGMLDQGFGRSISTASGNQWSSVEVAVGRAMVVGMSGRHRKTESPAVMLDFMERHGQRIRDIRAFSGRTGRVTSWMRPSVVAALARASYHLPMATVERFVVAASAGIVTGDRDVAALLLRDWAAGHTARGDDGRWEMYRRAAWAIEVFAAGRKVERLNMVAEDPFPLPGRGN